MNRDQLVWIACSHCGIRLGLRGKVADQLWQELQKKEHKHHKEIMEKYKRKTTRVETYEASFTRSFYPHLRKQRLARAKRKRARAVSKRVSKKGLLSELKVVELRKLAVELRVRTPYNKTKRELIETLQRKLTLEEVKKKIKKHKAAA